MSHEHTASTPAWIETSALTAPALLGAAAGLLLGDLMHRSARRGVGIGLGALGRGVVVALCGRRRRGLGHRPEKPGRRAPQDPTHPRRGHRHAGLRRSGRGTARARADLTNHARGGDRNHGTRGSGPGQPSGTAPSGDSLAPRGSAIWRTRLPRSGPRFSGLRGFHPSGGSHQPRSLRGRSGARDARECRGARGNRRLGGAARRPDDPFQHGLCLRRSDTRAADRNRRPQSRSMPMAAANSPANAPCSPTRETSCSASPGSSARKNPRSSIKSSTPPSPAARSPPWPTNSRCPPTPPISPGGWTTC